MIENLIVHGVFIVVVIISAFIFNKVQENAKPEVKELKARIDDLKSCPFCGGVAKLNAPGYKYYSPYWCKCTQCGAEGPIKSSELEAEKGWNERVQDDVEHTPIIDS